MTPAQTAQHTPGPWEVERYDRDYVFQQGRLSDKQIGIFSYAFEVARSVGQDIDSRAANARLIAAAPEWLAAWGDVAKLADFGEDNEGAMDLGARLLEIAKIANAAIAKAKEQP